MPPDNSGWLEGDKEFIDLLIFYEESNAFGNNYTKYNLLWNEIANRVNKPAKFCRKKWLSIKHNYLKLKNMIRAGRVTEDRVRNNPKTAKYFDGSLASLDRLISDTPDWKLPASVHHFFASSFDEEAGQSTNSVDTEKITEAKQRLIMDKPEIKLEPEWLLPNTEQGLEQGYRIDSDSNDLAVVIPLHQVNLPSIPLQQDNHIDYAMDIPIVPSSSKPRMKRGRKPALEGACNLAGFLVKYTNSNIENEDSCDLKEYMADLAEVLCKRLAYDKRKYFLSQIDLIVSDVLEGTGMGSI